MKDIDPITGRTRSYPQGKPNVVPFVVVAGVVGTMFLLRRQGPLPPPEEVGVEVADTHGLPATMFSPDTYTAKIALTNPTSNTLEYTIRVGIGNYPSVVPEYSDDPNNETSSGGKAVARVGAGATKGVSVPIGLNWELNTWNYGYEGDLVVVVNVVENYTQTQLFEDAVNGLVHVINP